MAAHAHAVRVPVPAAKPVGMAHWYWRHVQQRGWYCPNYMHGALQIPTITERQSGPERKICCDGPDYFSAVVRDPERFFAKTLRQTLTRSTLSWDTLQEHHPWLEWADLVHVGIVRALELRSDPRGEENPFFFAQVGRMAQSNYLRSIRRDALGERWDDFSELAA